MSMDWDYIFTWEPQVYVLGDPVCLALKSILDAGYIGTAIALSSFDLYWKCHKYGLTLAQIKFPIPPNQILHRANGGWWAIISND
jgi:hypothetical protein